MQKELTIYDEEEQDEILRKIIKIYPDNPPDSLIKDIQECIIIMTQDLHFSNSGKIKINDECIEALKQHWKREITASYIRLKVYLRMQIHSNNLSKDEIEIACQERYDTCEHRAMRATFLAGLGVLWKHILQMGRSIVDGSDKVKEMLKIPTLASSEVSAKSITMSAKSITTKSHCSEGTVIHEEHEEIFKIGCVMKYISDMVDMYSGMCVHIAQDLCDDGISSIVEKTVVEVMKDVVQNAVARLKIRGKTYAIRSFDFGDSIPELMLPELRAIKVPMSTMLHVAKTRNYEVDDICMARKNSDVVMRFSPSSNLLDASEYVEYHDKQFLCQLKVKKPFTKRIYTGNGYAYRYMNKIAV